MSAFPVSARAEETEEKGKVTFVDMLGLEGCEKAVAECTAKAKAAIASYDGSEFLLELADKLAARKK